METKAEEKYIIPDRPIKLINTGLTTVLGDTVLCV